jgi:hypothetical protein
VIAIRPESLVRATHNIIPIPVPEIGQRTCDQRFAHDRVAFGVPHRHESRPLSTMACARTKSSVCLATDAWNLPVTRRNFDDIGGVWSEDGARDAPRSCAIANYGAYAVGGSRPCHGGAVCVGTAVGKRRRRLPDVVGGAEGAVRCRPSGQTGRRSRPLSPAPCDGLTASNSQGS